MIYMNDLEISTYDWIYDGGLFRYKEVNKFENEDGIIISVGLDKMQKIGNEMIVQIKIKLML